MRIEVELFIRIRGGTVCNLAATFMTMMMVAVKMVMMMAVIVVVVMMVMVMVTMMIMMSATLVLIMMSRMRHDINDGTGTTYIEITESHESHLFTNSWTKMRLILY